MTTAETHPRTGNDILPCRELTPPRHRPSINLTRGGEGEGEMLAGYFRDVSVYLVCYVNSDVLEGSDLKL